MPVIDVLATNTKSRTVVSLDSLDKSSSADTVSGVTGLSLDCDFRVLECVSS